MTAVPPLAVGDSASQIVVSSSMFTSLSRTSIVTAFPWNVVAESPSATGQDISQSLVTVTVAVD